MLELTTVLKPNEACPVREIGEGLVIMAPEGDLTHSLEDLGAFIWRRFDGKTDLTVILEAVIAEYDADDETARKDLLEFARQLLDAGVVI